MKTQLEYKGYFGSVEVDLDDLCVYGRLLFISDVVSYRSADLASLRLAFESAVDDYLATCAELGDIPDTPCKGSFNVRIGPDLHQSVALAAARLGVTLNDWIKQACATMLAAPKAEATPDIVLNRASKRTEASVEFEDDRYHVPQGGEEWQQQQTPAQRLRH